MNASNFKKMKKHNLLELQRAISGNIEDVGSRNRHEEYDKEMAKVLTKRTKIL